MKLFHRDKLKKITLKELSIIGAPDLAKVWEKLELVPKLSCGEVLVAQLRIGDKDAFPIMAQLGYSKRSDVVNILQRSLGLSEDQALEFLRCHLDKADIIEILEERYAGYNGEETL